MNVLSAARPDSRPPSPHPRSDTPPKGRRDLSVHVPFSFASTKLESAGKVHTNTTDHNTSLPSIHDFDDGDKKFASALAQIKSKFPQNRWTLRFVDPALETDFWAQYSAMAVKHNSFMAAVCSLIFPTYLLLIRMRGVHKGNFALPYYIVCTALCVIVTIILFAIRNRPTLHYYQHHVVGPLCTAVVTVPLAGYEGILAASERGTQTTEFRSHIEHTWCVLIHTVVCSAYTGFWWSVVSSGFGIIGNYVSLSLCSGASSGADFVTQFCSYGLCGLTALCEYYVFESRLRSVFLMEHVVASSRGVTVDSVHGIATAELIDDIKQARQCRSTSLENARKVGPTSRNVAAPVGSIISTAPLHEKASTDESTKPPSTSKCGDNEDTLLSPSAAESRGAATPARLLGVPKSKPRLKAYTLRWWKRFIYVSWADQAIERNYLQWQHREFCNLFRLALFIQLSAAVAHPFLDVVTFCDPSRMAGVSYYLCTQPGPHRLRIFAFVFFIPVCVFAAAATWLPSVRRRPSRAHWLMTLSFVTIFSGYYWSSANVRSTVLEGGIGYREDIYKVFSTHAFNTLLASGGCTGLPAHHFHLTMLLALLLLVCVRVALHEMDHFIDDAVLVVCISITAGLQTAACERLNRRHFALRGVVLDVWREGGYKDKLVPILERDGDAA
ncbi:hypothetical protein DFJ77DRAFT_478422 [Powellomyces hirtus]|nr:hypothetical protein DFJ77DRAFT_478422 [Powellomyces hirtus]